MIDTEQLQFIAFRLGRHALAFEILQLVRIVRYEAPTPLPDAPDFLEGVLQVDGAPVPVVDLRRRLGLPVAHDDETRIMVLALGEQRVGVVVDEVRAVVRVASTDVAAPPPMVAGLAARYIAGLVAREGQTLVVLHPGRILDATEQLALADLAERVA